MRTFLFEHISDYFVILILSYKYIFSNDQNYEKYVFVRLVGNVNISRTLICFERNLQHLVSKPVFCQITKSILDLTFDFLSRKQNVKQNKKCHGAGYDVHTYLFFSLGKKQGSFRYRDEFFVIIADVHPPVMKTWSKNREKILTQILLGKLIQLKKIIPNRIYPRSVLWKSQNLRTRQKQKRTNPLILLKKKTRQIRRLYRRPVLKSQNLRGIVYIFILRFKSDLV